MRAKPQLIVIGAGGHALSVADAALSSGWAVAGFYSPDGQGAAASVAPILTDLQKENLIDCAIALGIGTNYLRESAFHEIKSEFPRAEIVSIIHATAWVSPLATVKPGAEILAHVAVGPGSTIRSGALLNTGASLDHDSSLGDFASLGPGTRTGGDVSIGSRTMVGMQSTVLHGITIGSDTVVGAHSLVNKDVESDVVLWGTPAKIVRSRLRDDPYY